MDPRIFQTTAIVLSNLSAFLTVLTFAWYRPRFTGSKPIQFLIIISLLSDSLNILFGLLLGQPKPSIGIVYRYGELTCLLWFYRDIFYPNRGTKNLIIALLLIIAGVYWFDSNEMISVRLVNNVIFILFSLLFFIKILRALEIERIDRHSLFWINNGVFVYFTGTFFLFLLRDYLINHHYEEYPYVWTVNNLLGIVKNFMFVYAFWLCRKG